MRRLLWTILGILVWMTGLSVSAGSTQVSPAPGPPPDITVTLTLDKATYYPGEHMLATVTLANLGGQVITKKGYSETPAWLLLQFVDEGGRIITSDTLSEANPITPPPPLVFPTPQTGELVQGDLVEILLAGWTVSFGPFDAYAYYPLDGRSGTFRVTAVVPTRTYLEHQVTSSGLKYAELYPVDKVQWEGSLESNVVNFTLVGDADGDGYYYPEAWGSHAQVDCDDSNPDVHPGATEILGNGIDDDCNPATPDVPVVPPISPGFIRVAVVKHTVGGGSHPGVKKEPCAGVLVRAYKVAGLCVSKYGVSWHYYKTIWLGCSQPDGAGTTGPDGVAVVAVPPGDYLVVGVYDPDGTPNYSGNEVYIGGSAAGVVSEGTVQRPLQIVEKQDGKKVPGKVTKLTGSELLIIEPEYVEWSGTQEYYPFVFESVGDWTVTTSVSPPEGFVADYGSLTEQVNTELEGVQFIIKDVGSKWEATEVTYTIKHKGKTEKIKSKIGVKLTKELAAKKGLDIWGNKKK